MSEAPIAKYGVPNLLVRSKTLGACPSSASPYRVRDARKTHAEPQLKAEVIRVVERHKHANNEDTDDVEDEHAPESHAYRIRDDDSWVLRLSASYGDHLDVGVAVGR